MTAGRNHKPRSRRGSAIVITLIFVAVFACLAAALAVASETNLALTRNRMETNQAVNLMESGLRLAQREMGGLSVTGDTAAALHGSLADHFRTAWAGTQMIDAAAITPFANGVQFPPITVTGPGGRTGTITLWMSADGGVQDAPTVTVQSTGRFGDAVRTVYYDFRIRSGYRLLQNYGVASKAPIVMSGKARIDGANDGTEGSIFSSANNQVRVIDLGGTTLVTGNAAASAPGAEIYTGSNATIGGDRITDAPEHTWPDILTQPFEQYVETSLVGGVHSDETLVNVRVPPNTNPTFNGNTTIYGVVYIEAPNKVTFNGNATVCGIIVCEEPAVGNLDANELKFAGTLAASGVDHLPADSRFDGLRNETGTFLLAPGYRAVFSGNFNTLNGCIVADQVCFSGNIAGTVRGNVLNMSPHNLTMVGDAHVTIDKSGAKDHPAGLTRHYSLVCQSGSYRE